MKIEKDFEHLTEELIEVGEMLRDRRHFIKAGMITGAASAFAMMAANGIAFGKHHDKDKDKDKGMKGGGGGGDVAILNTALGLEYQAIWAYKTAAGTGLLSEGVLGVAKLFLSQHQEHAGLEEGAIKQMGGTPVMAKEKYDLDLSGIKSEKDVLAFALGLEQQAAATYLSVTKNFMSKDLIPIVAGIGANEAQHAALLRQALGQNPVPKAVVG
jgi:ferritin-like protein